MEGLLKNDTNIHAGIRTTVSGPSDYENDGYCGFEIVEAREIDTIGKLIRTKPDPNGYNLTIIFQVPVVSSKRSGTGLARRTRCTSLSILILSILPVRGLLLQEVVHEVYTQLLMSENSRAGNWYS